MVGRNTGYRRCDDYPGGTDTSRGDHVSPNDALQSLLSIFANLLPLALAYWLAQAGFAAWLARARDRSAVLWYVLGLLFGPPGGPRRRPVWPRHWQPVYALSGLS